MLPPDWIPNKFPILSATLLRIWLLIVSGLVDGTEGGGGIGNGFKEVKIVVSSGFTAARIKEFVDLDVPFDAVGVGSTLFQEKIDFTADIVMVNNKPCAKVGRQYNPNPRLKEV